VSKRVITLALLVVACSAPVAPPLGGASATPERRATAEMTLPPVLVAAVGWSQLPASISPPESTGPCGQAAPRPKLASRIDPPVEVSRGRWRFTGCVYLSGGSLRQVFIELAFPDGTKLRALVAESTPPDQEYGYEVLVMRDDVLGVSAHLYAVTP